MGSNPQNGLGSSLPPLKATKVLDQLRERIRYLHYSRRTEEVYVHWCRDFIRFSGVRHPATLGAAEVDAYLCDLAVRRQLSTSTHRQALSALLFLYTKVLGMSLPGADNLPRPQPKRRLPVVLSRDELSAVFGHLNGQHLLLAQLLYGTGLRITEGLQLRVKDLDFAHRTIIVREGKGGKDRALMLPQSLETPLRRQLAYAHELQAGYDIRTVQDLLGHKDVSTTMIYTHVLKVGGGGVRSPLDALVTS